MTWTNLADVYLPLSGGTISGDLTVNGIIKAPKDIMCTASGSNYYVGSALYNMNHPYRASKSSTNSANYDLGVWSYPQVKLLAAAYIEIIVKHNWGPEFGAILSNYATVIIPKSSITATQFYYSVSIANRILVMYISISGTSISLKTATVYQIANDTHGSESVSVESVKFYYIN